MPGHLEEGRAVLGSSGIGRACALRFAEEGAHVCVADLDLKRAEETARG
jgi:NAD(P)-dependent dehydrogenase (short-subunit alcohol dehydrogenase family)